MYEPMVESDMQYLRKSCSSTGDSMFVDTAILFEIYIHLSFKYKLNSHSKSGLISKQNKQDC